jgi:L-iditol 2-dehydrogenase
VEEFTLGVGADIVICANPVARTQALAVEVVRKGGKVVLFGGLPKDQPMTTLNSNLIHYGEIAVVGSFSYLPKFHQMALELLAKKVISAEQFLTKRFSLDDVNEAYRVASSGKALKVIITF